MGGCDKYISEHPALEERNMQGNISVTLHTRQAASYGGIKRTQKIARIQTQLGYMCCLVVLMRKSKRVKNINTSNYKRKKIIV